MAQNPRRFDQIEKVVSDDSRRIDDVTSTVLSRLASHAHPYVPLATATTKGDIFVATGAGAITRLSVGSDFRTLMADSSQTTGLRWDSGNHEARYEATNGQSIANATDTKLQFPTAAYTTSDVTASGTNNTDFALNKAGVWLLTASTRYAAGSSGERHLCLVTGTNVGTLSARIAMQSSFPDTSGCPLSVATVIRASAGTSICAGTWQNNGTSLSIDTIWGTGNHISLTWLRPL